MARFKRLLLLIALVLLTVALSATVTESKMRAGAVMRATVQAGPSDPSEVEAFLDSVIAPHLRDTPVAGATLSLVRDGKILLAKGYGYADLARSIPVRADTTVFRIGSITKLFTWTAVMQLVEQGKLDLNADVNRYLDFKIPDSYAEPITLKHLMSHTPGFEDFWFGSTPVRVDQIRPLGTTLAGRIPARVRPPGQISAYSNYGTELAGYIVERVSGLPFQEYLERNIFKPLEMTRTSVRQPLPSNLASDMSAGYGYVQGAFQPREFQLIPQPEGAISSTAVDMAHFMIAHLQEGRYGDASILEQETARQMRTTLFRIDERVNGFTYGFWERDMNGQRVIGHPGSTLVFCSDLILLPEQNLGLYVSYNTSGSETLIDRLLVSFMDHYYPMANNTVTPSADLAASATAFAGSYRLTRSSYTSLEKVNGLLMALEVTAAPDGALVLSSPLAAGQNRFVPVAPLLFQHDTYLTPLVFRQDAGGETTHFLIGNRPDQTFEKLAWFEAPSFHYALLLICAVLFLPALVALPAGWLINRFRRAPGGQEPRLAAAGRWLLGIVAALNLLALVNFILVFVFDYNAFVLALGKGDISSINLALLFWLVAAILTAGAVVLTVLAWRSRYWGRFGRVYYTLVTLGALAFIWFLNYWNLLGWRV